jgi:hypothetical protein
MTQRSESTYYGVRKSRWIIGCVSTLALFYSLFVAYRGWGIFIPDKGPWPCIKIEQLVLLVIWSLVPPVWFWFEFYFQYLRHWEQNTLPPRDFDVFKHGQDVSAKIWIAVSSVLLVLYFGKDIRLGK